MIIVSLINCLGGTLRKVSNNRSSVPMWKKVWHLCFANSENGTKVVKLAEDFDISTTTLTPVSRNEKKQFLTFLIRVYAKSRYISGNPNYAKKFQMTRLEGFVTLTRQKWLRYITATNM